MNTSFNVLFSLHLLVSRSLGISRGSTRNFELFFLFLFSSYFCSIVDLNCCGDTVVFKWNKDGLRWVGRSSIIKNDKELEVYECSYLSCFFFYVHQEHVFRLIQNVIQNPSNRQFYSISWWAIIRFKIKTRTQTSVQHESVVIRSINDILL